jgi:dTDP-4-amino-4,6-dideoxygalactose transaminase
MDDIMALARRHGLRVIEDCAHAIEAVYRGRPVGTIGDLGCFSFYVTKNLTTAEGGMVLTADDALANRIKVLALHGLSKDAWQRFADAGYLHYEVVAAGFKYNMTDLHAALGLAQLPRMQEFSERRSAIWAAYDRTFADLPCLTPPSVPAHMVHAHHLYTLLLRPEALRISRDEVLDAMTAENIGVGVHYLAIPQHPFYRETLGCAEGEFANAGRIGAHTLSLPLSGALDDADVADVCEAVRRVLTYYAA